MSYEAIVDGFFLLQADARHKYGQLLSRPLTSVPGVGEVLIGLDSQSRHHLLIPVSPNSKVPALPQGGCLTLAFSELPMEAEPRSFADLVCVDHSLSFVFERLCADVVIRLAASPEKPLNTLVSTIGDWRALFSGKSIGMSRESLLGLTGELEVLAMLAEREPAAALESWVGPLGALRDFKAADYAIEVKSTASEDGKKVTISSLDQLDPDTVTELYLAVVHLRSDASAPSVDDRIRALVELGVPENQLIVKAAQYGHIFDSGSQHPDKYATQSVRFWRVLDEFPGLRRSEMNSSRLTAVEHVKYDLLLDAAGSPLNAREQDAMKRRFTWDE